VTRTYLWPPFGLKFLSLPRVAGRNCEDLRVERVLAFSRLLLSLTCLFSWLVRPAGTPLYYRIGLALLLLYVSCSVVLLVRLEIEGIGRSFAGWAQANDLTWPALVCLFANVSHRPFFVLFLFATIAAAFRWGLTETIATAGFSVALLLVQPWVAAHGPAALQGLPASGIDPIRLAMQCIFLLTAGLLLGFLAEAEKELRAEVALTNRLLSLARAGNRFSSVLQSVLAELGQVFRGSAVHEVVAQSSTGRAFRWELASVGQPSIHWVEVPPAAQASDLMAEYPHTFYMQRSMLGQACSVTAIDEEGRKLESAQTEGLAMPMAEADSVLVVSHEMGRDWSGRLVVVNPKLGRQREPKLRFLQDVMRQIAPALYSVYLLWGFRSRAGATERARVARELHDTTIQSLISIEMQLDVLRRRSDDSQQAAELNRIQGLLRHEVLNLRELMQTMRPVDIGPHQFLDFIADLVERFSRDTGIAVRFISELPEVTLPAGTCRELVRIVQESLVNIRKHSGAQSAVASFTSQDGVWKLVIDDDGNGFPFAGRLTLAELDTLRRGPAVIKERVRAIGGDMVIESTPGHGSRLEISIPQKGYELYG
jgi:signal transduction histidine kinase